MAKNKYLNKLSNTQQTSQYKNFYCDFETVTYKNQHYVTCYSVAGENLKLFNTIALTNQDDIFLQSDLLIWEFIIECVKIVEKRNINKKSKYLFFFHNLNKFDSYFLLRRLGFQDRFLVKLVSRNNQIYKITIHDKTTNLKLEFRDTLLYLPISLKLLSDIFCVNNKKKFFSEEFIDIDNYLNSSSLKDKLAKYCLSDSLTLQEGFENFLIYIRQTLNIEPLKSLSLPGISLHYFRSKFYDDINLPIEKLSKNKDTFIRKSYRGGVVDLFKPHLTNGFHYDINSLYPYVMKTFPMPIGEGKWVNTITDIGDFFGFIKVEVTSPEYMHKPFLNYYDADLGLISPIGTWTEVYFSEEIKYALKLGYKFKYMQGISYNKGILFKDFVNYLYDVRLKFPKGTPLNILTKLIMNSLYGKFGMKLNTTESKLIDNKEVNEYVSIYDVKNISTFGEKSLITIEKDPVLEKLDALLANQNLSFQKYENLRKLKININDNSAVHIASAITAYGRIEIDKFKRDPTLDVYYSDTDSIFCKYPISSEYISNTELGKFKLENEIVEAIFLCPKVYMIKNSKEETIIKCKGLNSQFLSEKDIYDIFYDSTNFIQKYVSNFVRNFKHLTIFKTEKKMEISTKLTKRIKVVENNKWIDTKPLKV